MRNFCKQSGVNVREKKLSCLNSFKKKRQVVPQVEILIHDGQGGSFTWGSQQKFSWSDEMGGKKKRRVAIRQK